MLFFFCLLHLTISLLRFMIGISTLQPYNHYSRMSLEIMEGKDSPKNNKKIPKESSKAKAAYYIYESLGLDRSVSKVAQQMGHPYPGYERHLEEWSRLYGWVKRAQAYDDAQLEKKRKARDKALDDLYDELAQICQDQRAKTLNDIEKLRKSKNGIGSIASVNLLKLLIDTHIQILGGNEKQRLELTGKDGGKIEVEETIVETFWGRGTDPRKNIEASEQSEEPAETNEEDTELTVEVDEEDEE